MNAKGYSGLTVKGSSHRNSQREAERENMEEKVIGGRYVCKKSLGKGGNGSVFLCWDLKLQKEWAVKELNVGKETDFCKNSEVQITEQNIDKQNCMEQTLELDLLKTISCNLFPRIVDMVYEYDKVYLVMDYVEGITLKEKMQRQKLTEKEVFPWAVEIAKALRYLHQMSPQILYMDCKPENIMLTPQGEIRLVDLGSVYICHSDKKQRISGTRFFAPKEQQNMKWTKQSSECTKDDRGEGAEQKPDMRSDIYAYGMTLYYLLAGKKKIYRRLGKLSIKDVNPAVSDGMAALIEKCTQSSPEKRPQSMDEVLYMLANIKQISRQERIKKRFWKATVLVGKCVCICILLACAWGYARWQQQPALIGSLTALVAFLILCMRRSFTIYEVKKEVFCGSGKRVLLYILVVFGVLRIMSISVFAEESKTEFLTEDWAGRSAETPQAEEYQELNVTIYDQKGRKILLQKGAVWRVSEDILISIPLVELGEAEGKITILYEDIAGENVKKYEFSCYKK